MHHVGRVVVMARYRIKGAGASTTIQARDGRKEMNAQGEKEETRPEGYVKVALVTAIHSDSKLL